MSKKEWEEVLEEVRSVANRRELKPCPFCGDKGFLYSYDYPDRPDYKWNAQVCCKGCTASCSAQGGFKRDSYAAEQAAIAAWNSRVPTSTGEEEAE